MPIFLPESNEADPAGPAPASRGAILDPHERLIQQKAELEVRIASQKSNVAQMQEQLGLGLLLKELQFSSGLWALIMTYLSFTFFVWMAGLMIE